MEMVVALLDLSASLVLTTGTFRLEWYADSLRKKIAMNHKVPSTLTLHRCFIY